MWQKGQSGNPNGRKKKGTTLTDLIEKKTREYYCGTETTYGQMLVDSLFDLAITKKDFPAIKYIFDRVDGSVIQTVKQTTNIETLEAFKQLAEIKEQINADSETTQAN